MGIEAPVAVGHSFERGGYCLGMADSECRREEVVQLIRRMYSWRGYVCDVTTGVPHGPAQTVFHVSRGGLAVATLTLRMDSSAGLLADGLYRDELDFYRDLGSRLCELTGLAVAPGEDSNEVLTTLFRSAYLLGHRQHGASDLVIEVNPRHVAYYQRRFGFRQAGIERVCPRVGAPAVLLHLDVDEDIVDRLAPAAGTCALALTPRSC